ncbi:hypothetical protein SCH4B_1507 [Ruegeria sp. TrichCH4B]|nr:hypothetical protein SCH4B_1507 [Ruegeria sp. TrichCH4B]
MSLRLLFCMGDMHDFEAVSHDFVTSGFGLDADIWAFLSMSA